LAGDQSGSVLAVREGIRRAGPAETSEKSEQAPAIATRSRWLRSKSRFEIRDAAMALSFGRCEGRNLKRFAMGIPKGIPIKILTKNKPYKSTPYKPYSDYPGPPNPKKKTPSGVFFCAWILGPAGRKIGFTPFLVGRFPKILPAPVLHCTR